MINKKKKMQLESDNKVKYIIEIYVYFYYS